MTISFPLAMPSKAGSRITFRARSTVGESRSPFTHERQTYVHQGEWWEAEIEVPPMVRANAEDWIGFLLALNGVEGTFLMGDRVNTAVRGTWAGSPLVAAAGAALGVKSIPMDGFSVGATVKRGDWFQIGTGTSSRLYKVTQDATADGSGLLTLEIWPRLRAALVDNATLDITSPVGVWCLASNDREWSIEVAGIYGLNLKCVESL